MKEEKRKQKLFEAELQVIKYNQIHAEIKQHLINYHKALSEIWQKPINRSRDMEILEKYGLVSEWRYNKQGYQWNWKIKELNQRIK